MCSPADSGGSGKRTQAGDAPNKKAKENHCREHGQIPFSVRMDCGTGSPSRGATGDLADLSHFDLKDSKGQKRFGATDFVTGYV